MIFDPLHGARACCGQLAGCVAATRSTAGRQFLAGKLGERDREPGACTLVDDALRGRAGSAAGPFDGEGLPTRRNARGRARAARELPARHLLGAQARPRSTGNARALGGQRAGRRRRRTSGSSPATASLEEIIARHAARPARDRADRHGLQPGDRRLLARRRGALDRERRDRATRSRRSRSPATSATCCAAIDAIGQRPRSGSRGSASPIAARRAHDGGGSDA